MRGNIEYVIDTQNKVIAIIVQSGSDIAVISSLLPVILSITLNPTKYFGNEAQGVSSSIKNIISFAGRLLNVNLDDLLTYSSSLETVKYLLDTHKQIEEITSDGWRIVIRKV